ncbi:hypothetical protein Tco_0240746 [Tanacetum coccineum]
MVFPQLDTGSTVLVDPGKTLYRKKAGKKAGCFDGKGRRYEKGGIMAIVEGEAHGGLGLRGGLLGASTTMTLLSRARVASSALFGRIVQHSLIQRAFSSSSGYLLTMDVNSGVFSRKNGAYTDDSKKNGRLFERAASMLVLIFEEKLAEKEAEIQILWNQLQQKSKSSTVEEIVETHAAYKKDTVEDVIVTMEDENKDS